MSRGQANEAPLRECGIKWDSIILGRPFRRGGLGLGFLVFNGATWRSICCSVRPSPRKCLAIVSMCSRISSDTTCVPDSSSATAVFFTTKCKLRLWRYVPGERGKKLLMLEGWLSRRALVQLLGEMRVGGMGWGINRT